MAFENKPLTRRKALTGAAAISAVGVAACNAETTTKPAAETAPAKKELVLNYKDPKWNRDALARIHGNLDFSKEKIGWFKGKAIGVVPGKKNL